MDIHGRLMLLSGQSWVVSGSKGPARLEEQIVSCLSCNAFMAAGSKRPAHLDDRIVSYPYCHAFMAGRRQQASCPLGQGHRVISGMQSMYGWLQAARVLPTWTIASCHFWNAIHLWLDAGSKGPAHLDERIDAFLATFEKTLKKLSRDDFEDSREALIAQKLQKDKSLLDESDRHWEQIEHHRCG